MLKVEKIIKTYLLFSTREKVISILSLLLLIVFIVVEGMKGRDFICYLNAAEKLLSGQNIYEPPFLSSRYLYHPLWATLLTPFLWIPWRLLVFTWTILNVVLFLRTIFILQSHFGVRLNDVRLNRWMWAFIVLCVARFLEHNFLYGQMTVFLLWAIIESVVLADKRKEITAGVLLGFSIVVKVMPLVMLAYFIFRRKWKASIAACVSAFILFFLPMLITGKEKFFELIRYWIFTLQPDSSELNTDNTAYSVQNLSTLLYRLLTDTGAAYSKNIFHLSYTDTTTVIHIILLLLILFTLYFLSAFPFSRALSIKHEWYELSYILLITPLIFPHQQKYSFLFMMPAVSCLLLLLFVKKQRKEIDFRFHITVTCLILGFILGTLTSDLFIGVHYSEVTQHLKTVTIAALLLIPALAINKSYFVRKDDYFNPAG